jgi:hypothetical protein
MKELKDLALHKVYIDSDQGAVGTFALLVNKKLNLYLHLCLIKFKVHGQGCLECFNILCYQ